MEKSIGITYDVADPGKKGTAVAKTISEEIKRIHDAVGQIDKVVVNCRQTDKKPSAMPEFDEVAALQVSLGIGEVTVNKKYSNEKSRKPREILEDLRRLHEELGDQISEIEDSPEDAGDALQSIYDEFESRLDELADALRGE